MAKIINIAAEDNLVKNKSFALLRTNPKLTSNIKLVADSSGDIYLSSIKASRTLLQTEFQKYPISEYRQYNRDVALFYGKLPKDKRYQVGREHTDLAVSGNYSSQYENLYNYGASFNYTKAYDEQYRIFAPIWLEDKVPQKYVIYRIKDTDFTENHKEDSTGQNLRIQEMLSKATIIKTFDLTNDSKLGSYLNNHIRDPLFTTSHVTFNFETDEPTLFSGIDAMIGGFVNKTDYIDDDYVREDLPEILANNTITSSFERNGIISSNIINIEFLFDDNEADDYNIYRYFGIYADAHTEGNLIVEGINKDGGLKVLDNVDLSRVPNLYEASLPTLSWVKDINDKYHHIRNTVGTSNTTFSNNLISTSYSGDEFSFVSKKENSIQTPVLSKDTFNGFIRLNLIKAPIHNDKIFLGDLLEISIENFNIGDFVFIADENLPTGTYVEGRYSCKGTIPQIAAALAGAIRNGEVIPYNAQSIKNEIIVDDYSQGRNEYTTIFGINSSNPYPFIDMTGCKAADAYFAKRYNDFQTTGGTVSGGLVLGDYDIYTMSGGCSHGQGVTVLSSDVGNVNVGDFVKFKRKDKYTTIVEIIKDSISDNYRVIFNKPVDFSDTNLLSTYRTFSTSFGKFSAYDFKDFNFDFYDTSNANIYNLELESTNYRSDESSFSISAIKQISSGLNYTDVIDASVIYNIPYDPSVIMQYSATQLPPKWSVVVYGLDIRDFIKKGDFLKSITSDEYVNILSVAFHESIKYSNTVTTFGTRLELSGEPDTEYAISNSDFAAGSTDIIFKPGDNSLNLFQFKKLSNIIEDDSSSEDERSNIEIFSEYDRLDENSLKETSINSRIIPTICKFAIKDGDATNSRNLPYILNVNEAFGVDNLSADISILSDRDSGKLNMEHFLIWNIPPYLKEVSKIPHIQDYVNPLEEDMTYLDVISKLKDTTTDYFSLFFTYTGAVCEFLDQTTRWAHADVRKLYTNFNSGDALSFSSTIFKGLRYIYKSRKEFTLSEPISFEPSSELNGYKYSTVLCYTKNQEESISSSADLEFIKNDKYRHITLVIHLSLPSNQIGHIDRYLSYTLEDILGDQGKIVDSNVRGYLKFGGTSGGSNWSSIATGNSIQLTSSVMSAGVNQTKFTEDIFKINGEYSYLTFTLPGYGNTQWGLKVVSVIDNDNLIVSGRPVEMEELTPGSNLTPSSNTLNETETSNIADNTDLLYLQGGKGGWKNVLNEIVAPRMAERINLHQGIKYTTISEEGKESDGLYSMEIQDGVGFIKTSILEVETDTNKPKAFKLSNAEIGYDLVARKDGGYYTNLRRMNGEYDPLFRNVISFTSPYGNNKVVDDNATPLSIQQQYELDKYNKLKGVNCMFASHLKVDDNFGIIPNFFYHKVNEEGGDVLKLSQETDKLPLYPLIGEIAIDKKKLNIFKSKYASDYYTRSYEGGKNVKVNGTLSPVEERSFFASTIMKVKNQYDITAYKSRKVNSLKALDVIRYDEKSNSSAYVFEDYNKIYIDFYIVDSIINELKEDNITLHYSKYANASESFGDKTTLEDDTSIYIKENIIPRFELDSIKIYGKAIANGVTELASVTELEDILSDGYLPLTNFEIRRFAEKPLDFRLIYNKKPGYNYKFRVHSKIIA